MDEKDATPLAMDEPNADVEVDGPKLEHEVAEPEPEAKAEDAQPRTPDGKFASKKGEETTAEAPPAPDDSPTVPRSALQDERRKRQELEAQVAALQRQFAGQPRTQEAPPPFWDDPDKAIDTRIKGAVEQAISAFQQQQAMDRINASEARAKVKYADYADRLAAFQQAAHTNRSLIDQMTFADDPGEFAYQTGKRAMDLERVGSFEELLKVERQKWEAEAKAAMPAPTFPQSTASDGSVAGRSGPAWAGPRADKDILPMG